MANLSIGKLAEAGKVKVDTIRHYEKVGLLLPVGRSGAGYRIYQNESLLQLRFIRKAQSLGFTLNEIKSLIQLSDSAEADCGDIRARANHKILEISGKIADLQRMKNSLAELAEYCPGKGKPLSQCGIIQHFYKEGL